MELLATRDDQQIWLREITRPYAFTEPFPGERYVCILYANDESISPSEQATLSGHLVRSGCRYAVCTGYRCSSWDDSIDAAAMTLGDFDGEDERFVMTTWHEHAPVGDVIFYGLVNTLLGVHEFRRFLILFVGTRAGLRAEVERSIESVWHARPMA